jgi:hydroxymethylpyrimidine pyrophosphatase-like HAD family hydrolase
MSFATGKMPGLWFMDFDGTLKPLRGEVSREDLTALRAIGEGGGIRVVATGRSIRTFERDWEPGLEIDYLISSAGLAVSSFSREGHGEILERRSFSKEDAALAVGAAEALGIGLVFCFPPPRTHAFYYRLPKGEAPPSFSLMIAQSDREPIPWRGETDFPLGQVLLIAEPSLMRQKAAEFREAVPWLSYVFTTSPYDDGTLWLEVYPPGVSKGLAAARLAGRLGLGPADSVALGNDYNDRDLLEWAGAPFLSRTGPVDMLPLFRTMPAAGEAPLRHVLDVMVPGAYDSFLERKGR